MKTKLFIGLLLLSSILVVNAQNTTFNNVAIGLNDPDWGVNIKTNFPSYTGGWQRGFFVSNETGGQHLLSIFAQGQSVNGVSSLTSSSIGKDFSNPYITFLPNGNVGIGTTSPNATLDLVSNSSAQGMVVRKRALNDFGNILFYDYTGTTGLGGIGVASDRIRIMSGGLGDSFERFSITSSGLVGINSQSPLNTFEVKVATSMGTNSSDGISIHDGEVYRLGINIGVNTAGQYSYLQAVKGGVGQKNIVINPTGGNVGIGTTNPTSKLTVAGNINSREVKVTVDAGADFVFEKEYNLPSLTSLNTYIKENKHLPEIASAKEMQANGINLSEMNIKLLQKIEEMTLYMIEQDKKLNAQSKEITAFKNVMERLSKIEEKLETKQ